MPGTYLAHLQVAAFAAHGARASAGSVTRASAIGAALIAVATLVVPFGGIVLFVACLTPRHEPRDDGDDDSGSGGGPGGPRGPGGGPPKPEGGPAWWPEFERQFAAYVAHDRRVEPVVATAQADEPNPPSTGKRSACDLASPHR